MLGEIAAAFASLKTAADIIKTLKDINTEAELASRTQELNQIILNIQQQLFIAQTAQFQQTEQINELKQQIAAMQIWEIEKENYQLFQYPNKTVVYRPNNSVLSYDICANCFSTKQIAILQYNGTDKGYFSYKCPNCQTIYYTQEIDYSL